MPGDGFRIGSAFLDVLPDLDGFRDRLKAELDAATSGIAAKVGVDADGASLGALEAELRDFGTLSARARATVDADDGGLHVLRDELDEFGARHDEARVSVDTGDSLEKLTALDSELQSKPGDLNAASNAAGNFSAKMALVAAAVPAATAALPALGGALAGVGGTLGAAGLALGGVQQALSDYMAVQNSAGQGSAQVASTALSNAIAIASAKQAIITAQQQVGTAEHSYTQALYAEQQAQLALTQARIQARLQLQQLNNAEIDGKLSVQAAQLALEQAQQSQQLTDANALTTQLQRQQAALAVAQAQRQLIEAHQNETNATAAANRANQQGVEGSPQVVAAKHALSAASYQVTQARQAEANAARALAAAQLSLTDTLKQQQLQMAASGSAANKFARDMAALTGPQRQLVQEFESFHGVLTRLEAVAGKAVLPGVTAFVQGLHAILPTISEGVRKFGGVVSSILGDLGKALESKGFQSGLKSIIDQGVTFMRLLEPIGGMLRSLFDLWAKSGPASAGLAKGLAAIAEGFGKLFKNLEPAIKPAGELLNVLGQAIGALGAPLGDVLTALLQALAPALKALLPGFKAFVSALGGGLSNALKAITPGLIALGKDIGLIATDLAPLLPALGELVGSLLEGLMPVLVSIQPLLRELTPVFTLIAQAIVGPLIYGLGGLSKVLGYVIGFIVELLTRTRTWIDIWHGLDAFIHGIIHAWLDLFRNFGTSGDGILSGAWNTIAGNAKRMWNDLTGWLTGIFTAITGAMTSTFSSGVAALGRIWGGIKAVFETPVNFLIGTVYDKGIARFWNDVVGAIGLGSLKLPVIATLAEGGLLPGYGGGDHVPALLEPGETVVDKDRSKVLAPVFKAAGVPGYGGGGIIGDITGGIGGIIGGIGDYFKHAYDMGRIVAAVTTGNSTALVNAIDALVGHKTPAAGELAQVMVDLPRHLFSEAAKHLVSVFASSGAGPLPTGSSSAVGSLPANWRVIASFLASHGFTKFAAAGVAGNVRAESGGNPEQLQIGGGGGGGLIQWTPYPPGYITGNYAADLMTQLHAILSWGGGPALVNRAKSPSNAAQIYQDYYERPANLTASLPLRMASANAVYQAMGWGKFDSGGWLNPGGLNQTGKPEAVLTPEESRALITMAKAAASGQPQNPVIVNINGTSWPNAEQVAAIKREMALALGG